MYDSSYRANLLAAEISFPLRYFFARFRLTSLRQHRDTTASKRLDGYYDELDDQTK